jgi:hypothetical protein
MVSKSWQIADGENELLQERRGEARKLAFFLCLDCSAWIGMVPADDELDDEFKQGVQDTINCEKRTRYPVLYLHFFELVWRYFGHLINLAYTLAHGTVLRRTKYLHQLIGHRDSTLKRKHISVTCRRIPVSWVYIKNSWLKALNAKLFQYMKKPNQRDDYAHEIVRFLQLQINYHGFSHQFAIINNEFFR